LAKNGSFDFAEGLALSGGAKANVPFVGRQNFKIFVRWVKKIKTLWCRQGVSGFLSVSFVFHTKFNISFSLSICCVVVFSPLVHNG
jgi:hypothetical protein